MISQCFRILFPAWGGVDCDHRAQDGEGCPTTPRLRVTSKKTSVQNSSLPPADAVPRPGRGIRNVENFFVCVLCSALHDFVFMIKL